MSTDVHGCSPRLQYNCSTVALGLLVTESYVAPRQRLLRAPRNGGSEDQVRVVSVGYRGQDVTTLHSIRAMTDPPGSPTTDRTDHHLYEAVAARRTQWDSLLWQVPVLSLTAQAFLFTISLGPDSSRAARVIASILSIVSAVLSMHLMARHRQAEIADAHWLSDYESRHFGETVHGPTWRARRNSTPVLVWLTRYPAFPAWMIGLLTFGLAAVVALLLAIFCPSVLA